MSERLTRILISFDCDSIAPDVLEMLAVLGDGQNMELTGLFVEDEDLLRAARLPGLREVSLTGEVRNLSVDQISRQLSQQATQAKARFEASVRKLNYTGNFRIVRGHALEPVAAAARGSDLVVITRSLRSSGLRARLGLAFETIVSEHSNVLFVNEPWASGSSVIALCESPEGGCARALATARRFAEREDLDLVIALPAGTGADPQVNSRERVVRLSDWGETGIVALCEREDARLLVLSPSKQLDWRNLLVRLMDRLSCSLLRLED
ncbi:MAG: hypothetical protein KDI31_15325 [Pseudomonadales bacterium]|nr:hypothetical protein [Pseudomonadales bacterium]